MYETGTNVTECRALQDDITNCLKQTWSATGLDITDQKSKSKNRNPLRPSGRQYKKIFNGGRRQEEAHYNGRRPACKPAGQGVRGWRWRRLEAKERDERPPRAREEFLEGIPRSARRRWERGGAGSGAGAKTGGRTVAPIGGEPSGQLGRVRVSKGDPEEHKAPLGARRRRIGGGSQNGREDGSADWRVSEGDPEEHKAPLGAWRRRIGGGSQNGQEDGSADWRVSEGDPEEHKAPLGARRRRIGGGSQNGREDGSADWRRAERPTRAREGFQRGSRGAQGAAGSTEAPDRGREPKRAGAR
ncbi:hypothetical protein B0H14DRAFT_2557311 [Mycena olivaceomarginata]|nr:hypothetical protein B0H14DRAFT_2557311 [Mycena olivaceomarginata]